MSTSTALLYYHSPVGTLQITGTAAGVNSVRVVDEHSAQAAPQVRTDMLPAVAECVQQLQEYFAGERRTFALRLDWSGATVFDRAVWTHLLEIPFGSTTYYADVARRLKQPKASRAVGSANGRNPLAIVVPCHRVVGKNGDLTGFAWGVDTKAALLRHERDVRYGKVQTLF